MKKLLLLTVIILTISQHEILPKKWNRNQYFNFSIPNMQLALNKNSSQNNDKNTTLDSYKIEISKAPLAYRLDSVEGSVTTYNLTWDTSLPEHLVQPVTWKHPVSIYKSENQNYKTALLVVNNGSNSPEIAPSDFSPDILKKIAKETNTIVISIGNVPNQPLRYTDSKQPLSEDASVARSWRLYMDNPSGNSFVPLHIPMMGATIKCMDMAQKVLEKQGIKLDGFIITGTSKRGWAAWLTMLADTRIKAIVPFAAEVLNLPVMVEHTQQCLGGHFPPAFAAYYKQGITQDRDKNNFKQLIQIEDPYSYIVPKAERFKIPKYLVGASGDDFFMPDNLKSSSHKLLGNTIFRAVPNCDHYGIKDFTVSSLIPFINRYQNQQAMPEISLVENQKTASNRSIWCSELPKSIKIYWANNPYLRDFRKNATPRVIYYEQSLFPSTTNTEGFQYDVPLLNSSSPGWMISYIQADFPDGFSVTTLPQVKPDTYPADSPVSKEEKYDRDRYIQGNQLLADSDKNSTPKNITKEASISNK